MHLVTITPPATEPVSLEEAKLHLRVEIEVDDGLIAGLIAAARIRAEALLRSTLIATVFDYFLDQFPCSGGGYFDRHRRAAGPGPGWLPTSSAATIQLPRPPLVSVASVQYYDSTGTLTTLSSLAYNVSAGNHPRIQPVPGGVWPIAQDRIDAVVVRYTAGSANAAAVPDNIKAAIKLMVGHWYEHREEVSDLATFPVPMAVDSLLAPSDPGIYA